MKEGKKDAISDLELKRLENQTDWDAAMSDYLLEGSPHDLAALLKSNRPITAAARHFVADILLGEVNPPAMRGKANAALTPSQKREIEGALWGLYSRTETVLIFLDELADERGQEPIELRRYIEDVRRKGMQQIADHFGLSFNTVRQYHDARNTAAWTEVFIGMRRLQGPNGKTFDLLNQAAASTRKDAALKQARVLLQHPDLFFPKLTE